MIEQGIVLLIQSGLGAPPLAPGGFAAQLPPNQISPDAPMAWTWRSLSTPTAYTLEGPDGFGEWDVEIACHGNTMDDALILARAIDNILQPPSNGRSASFQGQLTDPDSTIIQGIFNGAVAVDGFSDADRSYVRTLEYRIQYNQP